MFSGDASTGSTRSPVTSQPPDPGRRCAEHCHTYSGTHIGFDTAPSGPADTILPDCAANPSPSSTLVDVTRTAKPAPPCGPSGLISSDASTRSRHAADTPTTSARPPADDTEMHAFNPRNRNSTTPIATHSLPRSTFGVNPSRRYSQPSSPAAPPGAPAGSPARGCPTQGVGHPLDSPERHTPHHDTSLETVRRRRCRT